MFQSVKLSKKFKNDIISDNVIYFKSKYLENISIIEYITSICYLANTYGYSDILTSMKSNSIESHYCSLNY